MRLGVFGAPSLAEGTEILRGTIRREDAFSWAQGSNQPEIFSFFLV